MSFTNSGLLGQAFATRQGDAPGYGATGYEDVPAWQLAVLNAIQGINQNMKPGVGVANVLSGAATGAAGGLLQAQANEKRRGLLDQALESIPEDERAAYRLMTPAQRGEAIAKRQKQAADSKEMAPFLGMLGLGGGAGVPGPGGGASPASPAGGFPQQPVATPDATPVSDLAGDVAPSSPAAMRVPVGRTSSALLTPLSAQESGGRPDARNPRSTATGQYQFIDGTWRQFAAENPGLFQGMTPEQVLAARTDPALSEKAALWYAGKNAEVLGNAGLPPTAANLGLSHRFGGLGAVQLLQADPSTPMERVVSPAVMAANPDLSGKTVGQVRGDYQMRYGNSLPLGGGQTGGGGQSAQGGQPVTPVSQGGLPPQFSGQTVTPNVIFGMAGLAARGNEMAARLLPILQGMTKREAESVVIAPGGSLVNKQTGAVIYQSPDREDQQLVQVAGPDGKPIWVRRSAAEGQQAFSAPQVAIDQRGTSTYDQERGKTAAQRVTGIEAGGTSAVADLRRLDLLERSLAQFSTGPGSQARITVGQWAQRAGVDDDTLKRLGIDKATVASGEQIQAIAGQMLLGQIGSGGFPANNFSDADRAFLQAIQPGLERSPEGNRVLIGVMRDAASRNLEVARAWRDWQKQHGDSADSARQFQATRLPEITERDILAPKYGDIISAQPSPTGSNPGQTGGGAGPTGAAPGQTAGPGGVGTASPSAAAPQQVPRISGRPNLTAMQDGGLYQLPDGRVGRFNKARGGFEVL